MLVGSRISRACGERDVHGAVDDRAEVASRSGERLAQPDDDARVATAEVSENGAEVKPARAEGASQDDRTPDLARDRRDIITSRLDGIEDPLGRRLQDRSVLGDGYRRDGAVQQGYPEFTLEPGDRAGHGRLDDVDLAGGGGKAPCLAAGEEVVQVADLHVGPLSIIDVIDDAQRYQSLDKMTWKRDSDGVANLSPEEFPVVSTQMNSAAGTAARPLQCVVVGGSLVGLSTAIALSRVGFEVTVVEQSPARAVDGGGGLGVDVALLREVTGIDAEPPVLRGIDRDGTAWHLLQGWLEDRAVRLPGVTVLLGQPVSDVASGSSLRSATVDTAAGDTFTADLVVGADGARSAVRATVDPQHPDATYAGVLLWRTLMPEQAIPRTVALPGAGEPARAVYAGPYRLVTYPVPGPHGETAVGKRRLNMVWYDPEQSELLHATGLLDGQTVHGSLAPGALPGPVRERLSAFAAAKWPSPWGEALTLALDTGTVFGTPIVEYKPAQLVAGRVALAGDAAHAASPMVGGGFRQGLYDVQALVQAMSTVVSADEVPDALARYQERRLAPAIRHVTDSEHETAAYLAHAVGRADR
jgi:2-polyprenyl-6-methoxyphenol hydroxylase-like FAD-dependent oxidoreductase